MNRTEKDGTVDRTGETRKRATTWNWGNKTIWQQFTRVSGAFAQCRSTTKRMMF